MYQLSLHAVRRIKERKLRTEWLLAALDGKQAHMPDGTLILVDPATRCALFVAPNSRIVVTAMKLRPAHYRRIFSRRRKSNGRRMASRTSTHY